TAPASVGYPAWNAASTAWIESWSIISSAAGRTPAATMDETAFDAVSIVGNGARSTLTASGLRVRRTITLVTIPSVPSEPTSAPVRSNPGDSGAGPPVQI